MLVPDPVKKNWAFRVAAVLLSVMVTLALLELVAWLLLHKKWPRTASIPTNEWVSLTGHGRRLKPNLDFEQMFEVSNRMVHFRTNSLGFRGKEVSLEKKPGSTRILVLGDSITLSPFLPEEEVYPALLEKILSAARPVEVINAGVSDVGLEEELWIFKETAYKLKPDIVLLGFYLNDSRPPWGFENEYYHLPPWLIEKSKTVEQYSYLYKWVWKRFLVKHFLGRNAAARWDWRNEYVKENWITDQSAYQNVIKEASMDFGAAWQEDSWKKIYSGLDQMQTLAQKHNFKLSIIIFPVELQVRSQVYDAYPQQKMLAYCKEHSIPCLDLLPLLQEHKNQDIFFDHCHLNALGHQMIATPIASFLVRNFFSKAPGP